MDMMKRALQNKQYAEIDHAIKTKVEPFLYNRGKGRYIPVSHLVLTRNKERSRHKLVNNIRSIYIEMKAMKEYLSDLSYNSFTKYH